MHWTDGSGHMGDKLTFVTFMVMLALIPLSWRIWRDRQSVHALTYRARIEAALRNALGGECLVAVDITMATIWRRGHVTLAVPNDYVYLIKLAWDEIFAALPKNYDLVIHAPLRIAASARYCDI